LNQLMDHTRRWNDNNRPRRTTRSRRGNVTVTVALVSSLEVARRASGCARARAAWRCTYFIHEVIAIPRWRPGRRGCSRHRQRWWRCPPRRQRRLQPPRSRPRHRGTGPLRFFGPVVVDGRGGDLRPVDPFLRGEMQLPEAEGGGVSRRKMINFGALRCFPYR